MPVSRRVRDLAHNVALRLPGFEAYWEQTRERVAHPDGHVTPHGLFMLLTDYLRERSALHGLDEPRLAALGEWIEWQVTGPDAGVANAVVTCLLENLAGEEPGRRLRPHLGPRALEHYERLRRGVLVP